MALMPNPRKRRVKLTTDNHCHKPPVNAQAVEALIEVAAQGPEALAAYLAAGHRLDVGAGPKGDRTALHALARDSSGQPQQSSGRADRVALETLLDAGLSPHTKNYRGESAFHRAVVVGLVWFAQACHDRGLDDWEATDNQGRTPLQARAAVVGVLASDPVIRVHDAPFHAMRAARALETALPGSPIEGPTSLRSPRL